MGGKTKVNIDDWGGVPVTGRDVTDDVAKLQNLDVPLSLVVIGDPTSPLYLGVSDLQTDKRLMVASGMEVGFAAFTVQNLVDNYGVIRIYDYIQIKDGGAIVLREGSVLSIVNQG